MLRQKDGNFHHSFPAYPRVWYDPCLTFSSVSGPAFTIGRIENFTTPPAGKGNIGSQETAMLDAILSHWMTYPYVAYVLVLFVLCLVYRPRGNTVSGKLRQLH
jgi:hypothetical protein